MGSHPQLSLFSTFQSEIIDHFVAKFSTTCDEPHKISELENYVVGLQDEMKKIDAFKRDLPLIISLLNEAVMKHKDVLFKCKKSKDPVLEEFIPLQSTKTDEKFDEKKEKDVITSNDKKNWMSSVQLWHSNDQNKPCLKNDFKKVEEIKWPMVDLLWTGEKKVNGTGFVPYKGCSNLPVAIVGKDEKKELPIVPLSLSTPEIKISMEDLTCNDFSSNPSSSRSVSSSGTNSQSQNARKQRRCWSPELHRRFINALQQLGGAQVATPKQIRELMQVDGLTNDEVKSHLQKYRLHTRKANTATNTSTTQPLGLWVSREQCGESSKASNSQSGSPQGPFHLVGSSRGTSVMTDSMEEENDEKTESHSWKSHNH